jgi:hypothetical protein
MTHPNARTHTNYFSESADGHFIIQIPNSTGLPDLIQVIAGSHSGGIGKGYIVNYTGFGHMTTMSAVSLQVQ